MSDGMSSMPRAASPEAAMRRHAAMRKPKAPQQNRARIVAAAIDEFAARGFKGAAMDAIAARTQSELDATGAAGLVPRRTIIRNCMVRVSAIYANGPT